MTDEELAARLALARQRAAALVPEWNPAMTAEVGYAGNGQTWLRHPERMDPATRRKERKRAKDRRRYLKRAADPDKYAAYLAGRREYQAGRDAAKRAGGGRDAGGCMSTNRQDG